MSEVCCYASRTGATCQNPILPGYKRCNIHCLKIEQVPCKTCGKPTTSMYKLCKAHSGSARVLHYLSTKA